MRNSVVISVAKHETYGTLSFLLSIYRLLADYVPYFPEYKPHFEHSKFTPEKGGWVCGLYSDDQIKGDKWDRCLYFVAKT